MTYDKQYLYLTWGGRIGSNVASPEIWQTGVHIGRMATGGVIPPVPTGSELSTLAPVLGAFHGSAGARISEGAVLTWVKAVRLLTNGKYDGDAVTYELDTPVPGATGGDSSGSPQDSMVISLDSGSRIGRANFGRIYTPWSKMRVASFSGTILDADVLGFLTEAKTLVDGINSWAATTLTPGDFEILITSAVTPGNHKKPYLVRIGGVVDTQRRRRNRLQEAYSALVL